MVFMSVIQKCRSKRSGGSYVQDYPSCINISVSKPSQPTDQTKRLGAGSVGKNTYSAIMRTRVLIPRTHIKARCGCVHAFNSSTMTGGDRKISGACWLPVCLPV